MTLPVKSLIGLISSKRSRRPFSMNHWKDSSWSSMRLGTSNLSTLIPSRTSAIRAYDRRPEGVAARGADLADSMKDGSLTEWEEGGTAALTEGVGYRDPLSCQPKATGTGRVPGGATAAIGRQDSASRAAGKP